MSGARRQAALRSRDVVKRAFDIAVAGVLLVLLSPVILLIAILVRLRLGSPIIFAQERPGLRGKPFTILKFRSMLHQTHDDGKPLTDVERTPPFGQRLRSLSLDELPELLNVLRGDMSLVGPRPLLKEYLPRYTPEQMRRHEVRPGITGLAQISGRNALTWEQKFALDLEYVDHHDLWMDLAILVRTIGIILARDGIRHAEDSEEDMPEFTGTMTGKQVDGNA